MKFSRVIFIAGALVFAAALMLIRSATTEEVDAKKSVTDVRRHLGFFAFADPKTMAMKDSLPSFKPLVDTWKQELYERLDRLRASCGELCAINNMEELEKRSKPLGDGLFPTVTVPGVDCLSIFRMAEMDVRDTTFPTEIPTELQEYFSMSGAIKLSKYPHFIRQVYLEGVWTKEDMDSMVESARAGTLAGIYGIEETNAVSEALRHLDVAGKKILVIGSEEPWLEAVLLARGAGKITTMEYGRNEIQHPQITTESPESFRHRYLNNELVLDGLYDAVVSHSSIEHLGLGRYGDSLNPWGDILTVARAWCVTKDDGILYLGLPNGSDSVMYNAHREYGAIRWPLVTANWMQIALASGGPIETEGILANKGYAFRKASLENLK